MKMRLLGALVGLAIGFAVPAIAQEKEVADPEIRRQLDVIDSKFDEAFDKNDAAAIASLFTQDAVDVTPDRSLFGTASHREIF